MKAAFLILSAINKNTANSSNAQAQLEQLLLTLNNQFSESPNALIEYSETPLNEEQKKQLLPHADLLAEFRSKDLLTELKSTTITTLETSESAPYYELLKIVAFNWFLQNAHNGGLFKEIDYVVVIEADATNADDFLNLFTKIENIKNKFFFKKALNSNKQNDKSRNLMHYPTSTWAYSVSLTDELIDNIVNASENAYKAFEASDSKHSTNLGHELFNALDLSKVHFLI